jgi:hypothetical protein
VGRRLSGGEQVGSKEKGTPTQACSRHPRQGVQQNRTWPTPPFGGVATSSASAEYKDRRPVQVGGFVWKQLLTLTRLSECEPGDSPGGFLVISKLETKKVDGPENGSKAHRQSIQPTARQPRSVPGVDFFRETLTVRILMPTLAFDNLIEVWPPVFHCRVSRSKPQNQCKGRQSGEATARSNRAGACA